MSSSTRQAIACILLTLATAGYLQAQQPAPEKVPSGSISGAVTLKGKGVSGVVVFAIGSDSGQQRKTHRATTDQLGNYSITNLPVGHYEISLAARSFVSETVQGPKSLLIGEGETIEKIDFALVRGGVITGRVTDVDGEPLIEEQVTLTPAENSLPYGQSAETDDRGVYRVFGVRPGKYKVSAGREPNDGLPAGSIRHRQTFHPSVTDPAKATVIEVSEGGESSDVDIVLGRPAATFSVSGRMLDGETGKPLANVRYGLQQFTENGGRSTQGGATTNAAGEFKLDNMLPGKYAIYVVPDNLNVRSEPSPFEVKDRDLTGLVVKTTKGASVSGVITVEDGDIELLKTGEFLLFVHVDTGKRMRSGRPPFNVRPDRTFKVEGLEGGVVRFDLLGIQRQEPGRSYSIVRVERDGVPQPNGIELREREDITGVRLVIRELSGKIRGVVKTERADAEFVFVSVSVARLEDDPAKAVWNTLSSYQLDARGRFVTDGLAPGTYEVRASAMLTGNPKQLTGKERVIVTDNSVSEVTVTLTSKPDPDQF